MADAPWKRTERRIARRLGGRRLGSLGRSAPDVIAGGLSVEVKHRRRLPAWLKQALSQAERGAPSGSLPLVVLHEAGSRDDVALLRLSALLRLIAHQEGS